MTISSHIDSRSALLGAGVEDEDEDEDDAAGVRVVRLGGELDAFSAPSLRDDLHREVVARPAVVALDLSDLEFLGVPGLYGPAPCLRSRVLRGRRGPAPVVSLGCAPYTGAPREPLPTNSTWLFAGSGSYGSVLAFTSTAPPSSLIGEVPCWHASRT